MLTELRPTASAAVAAAQFSPWPPVLGLPVARHACPYPPTQCLPPCCSAAGADPP